MDMTTRFFVVGFGISLVVACSKPDNSIASEEVYLKCQGTISIFKDGPLQVVEKQEIVAHIKNKRISFSGNDFLSGEGVPICMTGASMDQPYFDSESCDKGRRNDPKRKYGSYNKITGALDLTNGVSAKGVAMVTGRFKCVKTEPVVK